MKKLLITALIVGLASPVSLWAGMTSDDLPGVPLEVIRSIETPIQTINLKPKFKSDADSPAPSSDLPESPLNAKPADGVMPLVQKQVIDKQLFETTKVALNVILGENMILPIAAGHPNRLRTPFETPKVTTLSDAQISVDQSIIYVTPNNNDVVTMFVTEKGGDQQAAVSLTLVPKAIPPREIRLLVSSGKGQERDSGVIGSYGSGYSGSKAIEWEKDQEYTEALKSTLRELAMNRTPAGYGLRGPVASDPMVSCKIPGLKIEPGQTLDGHSVLAVISKATNINTVPMEVNPGACYQPGVLAASAWPSILLAPGQATELYVLFKRPTEEAQSSVRPSLLGGQQ